MSTLVVSYRDLEDAAKDARKAAALLEEYEETIEEKICKKLKEYSGSWTSNIDVADQLMRDKLVQLRQKQEDFETLAANIETFKNNCVTADNNVKAAIESLSGDFKNTYGIKENIVTKWFNYIGTEIGNGGALGRYLKDIGNTIEAAVTDGIENIKDWYKYEGGKYIIDDIVTVALVTLEVVGAVVAIASGVGAIVAIATVIAATMTVANGLTSIYNNSKAYNAMQNENPAWAMRYAGRDTLTEQMRETSDSKFVHNFATGLDVLETSAGLILFAKDGMDALKSIKNFSGKCRILGNGGTDLIDDAAQLGAKSADGIPGKTVVDDITEMGLKATDDVLDTTRRTQKSIIESVENSPGGSKSLTNLQKGNYGEMKMDDLFESQGYQRISTDRVTDLNIPPHQGIDGVYYKPDRHPPYVIGEAKYGSSKLGKSLDGKQMSDTWINGSNRLENAVGKDMADEILMEGYEKAVVHIDTSGSVTSKNLD
ncbi:hypothetical protein EDD66_101374 [Mobilisporobacter senegalensis]|uniref:Uncharacterized protein n=1 Tax=Mobilisporobacter senegalensis TaxID=1329262 RepID=A0A3N1XYS2_9FIRM|nr:hypothetical protein [Mobilisporobacter senegalensis]ROR31756.1 hypothetical protein EDD66_101374 [Mobilisporobacter senegalensis]